MVTKTNDGGLAHMQKECKVVWINPSTNTLRCPVRLIEKYMSLCPPVGKNNKANFYLRSLEKMNPAQWYSTHVLGVNSIRSTVSQMLEDAKLDGYFTNHSLRSSGTTRLFQAGVDKKLIKEFTGHSSDAVDNYQVTSDQQRCEISAIIAGNITDQTNLVTIPNPPEKVKSPTKDNVSTRNSVEITVTDKTAGVHGCNCKLSNINLEENEKIGQLVSKLLEGRRFGKATIKLEVEFSE